MADRTILPVGQPRRTAPVAPPVRPGPVPTNGPFLQNKIAAMAALTPQGRQYVIAANTPQPASLSALAAPAPTHVNYNSPTLNNPAFAQARQHILDTSTTAGNDINSATNNAVGSMLSGINEQHAFGQQNANALNADTQAKLAAYRSALAPVTRDVDLAHFGGLGAVTSQSLADQKALQDAATRVKAYETGLGGAFDTAAATRMSGVRMSGVSAQQQRLVNEYAALQNLDQQAQKALAAASGGGGGGGGRGGGRRRGGGSGGSGGGSGSGLPSDNGPDFGMMAEGLRGQYMPGGLSDQSQNYYSLASQMLANGTRPQDVKTFFDRLGQQNRAKGGGLMKGGSSGFGSLKAMDNYINAYNKMVGDKIAKLYGNY